MGLYCRGFANQDESATIEAPEIDATNSIAQSRRLRYAAEDLSSRSKYARKASNDATHHDILYSDNNFNLLGSASQKRRLGNQWKSDPDYPGRDLGLVRPNVACHKELLEDEFVVIWKALNESLARSSVLVWADEFGTEVKYSIMTDAIIRDPANWRDKSFFAVATVINLVFSTFASLILAQLFWGTCAVLMGRFEQDTRIDQVASHRLDHGAYSRNRRLVFNSLIM